MTNVVNFRELFIETHDDYIHKYKNGIFQKHNIKIDLAVFMNLLDLIVIGQRHTFHSV